MQICSLNDLSLISGSMEVEAMGTEADGTEKLCGKILPNALSGLGVQLPFSKLTQVLRKLIPINFPFLD